jgi:hypothetical protein
VTGGEVSDSKQFESLLGSLDNAQRYIGPDITPR